ncbi:MAG: carboxypeptidase-like regulatory domain-containing protein [Prolixibacteraceae bacterium]
MNLTKLLLLVLFIPTYVTSQTTLSGSLLDSETKLPVEFATVYVDGTMKGTISDTKGFFLLENLPLPCKVVVSHVNYETTTTEYAAGEVRNLSLHLGLHPRQLNIKEVVVLDKNRRDENLKYFERTFLGNNKWGNYAFIENDSILFFTAKTRTDLPRNLMLHPDFPDSFRAEAFGPLKIELPLLGYQLYANLEYFTVNYLDQLDQYQTRCHGLTYFIPTEVKSGLKRKLIEEHRKEVYYNSRLHFFRSINENTLKSNGYLIVQGIEYNIYNQTDRYETIDLDSSFVRNNGGTKIIGLKDKIYYILYYQNFKKDPIDLNKKEPARYPIVSSIYFGQDTCVILESGRVADQSIIFGPAIGDKLVGTWLPDDYWP